MNGRLTAGSNSFSYEDAMSQKSSNHWSSTENNTNNARNVNFNDGNANNNNKYNGNVLRPVAAFKDYVPTSFIDSVWEAFRVCLKGKMGSSGALEYLQESVEDIPRLALELWTGSYTPGTSTCFLVRYPKWREVFAANFRDRIVHHWICLRLEPLFEERFVSLGDRSFNCRKGYGTEKAVEHVVSAMEKISEGYRRPSWVFRGDLVGFFMSIDKDLLWYFLERFITRWRKRADREGWRRITDDILSRMNLSGMPEMYWDILIKTTNTIVMHHPEVDCVLNSSIKQWEHLTPNKSLFTSETGEPIGNLTTQLFANFLMSYFVMYVTFLFRRKHFEMAQFVDDFIEVCDDLDYLVSTIPLQERFLKNKLHLTMHKNKRYLQPVSHGVLFVGTYIKPKRKYLSNRVVGRMCERCKYFERMLNHGECNDFYLTHIEQVVNSYLGFCKRRKTYKFRSLFVRSMGPGFWSHFTVKGHYESVRVKPQYRFTM